MRIWADLLGGLIIWAVHFFALYLVASIYLTSTTSRILATAVTLGCLLAAGLFVWQAWSTGPDPEESFGSWSRRLALLSGIAVMIAILWQGLPAVLI